MAYLAINSNNGRATIQNNVKVLRVRYQLSTPVTWALGTEPSLSSIIPASAQMSVLFKTKRKGTFDIMSNMPLLALCALSGLDEMDYSFIYTDQVLPSYSLSGTLDALPPTSTNVPITGTISNPQADIIGIEFNVPLFEKGRILSDGDNLDVSISGMPVGDNIEVWVSDFPYSFENEVPYRYRTQTVLSNNDYQVQFKGKVIFPNDPSQISNIQMSGNCFVQWDLRDFYANPTDIWATNKNTYMTSNYLMLDTSLVSMVKFKAGNQFDFYYKDKF